MNREATRPPIQLMHSEYGIGDTLMIERMLVDYNYVESANWRTELTRYPTTADDDVMLRTRHGSGEWLVLNFPEARASANLNSGHLNLKVAGTSPEVVSQVLSHIRSLIPVAALIGDTRPVNFWSDSSNGPRVVVRMLEVPTWEQVSDNYTAKVSGVLDNLVAFKPSAAGQLILWRGEPGTGKTWALRALIREWDWARFHYITDPDALFGTNPSYMLHVVLGDEEESDESGLPTWKVLILEDSGEMLSKDARERTGQGLSRLLNLVDGLIGQGLRLLVLVTTNEELGVLHSAISRPGRCAYNIEFSRLTLAESNRWRERHGAEDDITTEGGGKTIAELFSTLDGHEAHVLADREPAGFRNRVAAGFTAG